MQKRKYNDSFDFEQYSNSDSVQFSDSNQVLYKIQLDINKEFKKIEKNIDLKKTNKEVVSKKPEKNKITNEEFKTKENQEKIEVWKLTKENSKERKAYEDEMDKVKSNDLSHFLRQFIYQFYVGSQNNWNNYQRQ